jgi:uncharacterized protein YndB with AHSA1/START domain
MKEALRASTTIPVAPTTLYFAWLSSEQHSAMTGGKAKIEPDVGTKFTAWDGYISGKLITLDLGRRIIMSWRTTDFPRDAADSRVEVHLEALGGNTRLTILHTEIPEGQGEKYRSGWTEHYFDPMRRYFSKYLPDPRKPPPPRPPPPPMDEEEDDKPKGKKGKVAAAKVVVAKGPTVAKVDAKKGAAPAKKPAPPAKAPAKAAKKPAAPAKKPAPAKVAPKKPAPKKPAPKKPAAKKPAAKKPAPKKK